MEVTSVSLFMPCSSSRLTLSRTFQRRVRSACSRSDCRAAHRNLLVPPKDVASFPAKCWAFNSKWVFPRIALPTLSEKPRPTLYLVFLSLGVSQDLSHKKKQKLCLTSVQEYALKEASVLRVDPQACPTGLQESPQTRSSWAAPPCLLPSGEGSKVGLRAEQAAPLLVLPRPVTTSAVTHFSAGRLTRPKNKTFELHSPPCPLRL